MIKIIESAEKYLYKLIINMGKDLKENVNIIEGK